ncbi:MAG: IclR family transcriptional regulator [Rhodospirillales bacterium]|jgi:DNA-binding IclR family transcriptional regulator|nr:IclR family transcriptional regulator [Rhodospirillales bacterium]
MSSLERLLSILDLYSEAEPIWTLEEIMRETGYARSTAYRYVKELCDSGLLISIGKGAHVLGPRFIEFDRLIRNTDPLLMAAQNIMPGLHQEFGESVLLLSSLYGEKVLCIHQEPLISDFIISYARGRPMPLFYGATAKIILANLPERRLVKLFLNHRIEIAKAGLGEEWEDFKEHLAEMRRLGYCISKSEVDLGVVGVGTAIFADNKTVIGSLTHVVQGEGRDFDEMISDRLIDGCNRISIEIVKILDAHDDLIDSYSPVIPFKKSGS